MNLSRQRWQPQHRPPHHPSCCSVLASCYYGSLYTHSSAAGARRCFRSLHSGSFCDCARRCCCRRSLCKFPAAAGARRCCCRRSLCSGSLCACARSHCSICTYSTVVGAHTGC
jgi:hypothetical protein